MSPLIPVVAIAFYCSTSQKYLIAKRKLTEKYPGAWEFPGGKVEANETPEQALVREIEEELGVHIEVLKLHWVADNIHQYLEKKIKLSLYFYSVPREIAQSEMTLTDHAEIVWCSLADIKNYALADADLPFLEILEKNVLE